jgi:hypothetical protein
MKLFIVLSVGSIIFGAAMYQIGLRVIAIGNDPPVSNGIFLFFLLMFTPLLFGYFYRIENLLSARAIIFLSCAIFFSCLSMLSFVLPFSYFGAVKFDWLDEWSVQEIAYDTIVLLFPIYGIFGLIAALLGRLTAWLSN